MIAGPQRPPPPRTGAWLLPCLLAAPMLLAADLTDRRDLLVPPALALAFGVWVARRPDWLAARGQIVVLPVLAAALGLVATRLPGPRWVLVAGTITAALLLLQLARCRIAPVLAVAVLPVVFDVRGVGYLAAVAVLAAAVLLGAALRAAACLGDVRAGVIGFGAPGAPVARWPWPRVGAFWLAAVAWAALGLGVLGLPPLVAAPPLFVATLEFALTGGPPRRALRRCGLLAAAATTGACAMLLGPLDVLAGTLAVAVVALLARSLAEPLAPAFAVALVPFVAGVDDPWRALACVGIGALALHAGTWLALAGVARWHGRRFSRPAP
ncbi:MAG: hypothetical protein ACT4RN_17650 [Pseudonocardia sp.]